MSNGRPLENQVAVVTGAGQGNGRAIALRLAADGAMVFGTDLRPDLLTDLEDFGRESELKIATGVYDASKPADADSLVAQVVGDFGKLDIMVNNAGAIWAAPFPDVTEEIWDRTMDLNLKGLYFHMQAAARPMIEQGSGRHYQPGFHSRSKPRDHAVAAVRGQQGSRDEFDHVGRNEGR